MYGWFHQRYLIMKPWIPPILIKWMKEILFPLRFFLYNREIEKRKRYSVFDYQQLAEDMPLLTREYGCNAFYGLADIIKQAMGLPPDEPVDGIIEHGLCIPQDSTVEMVDHKKNVYVMGIFRQKFLQKMFPEKKIYSIGPYIQYVDSFYSESWIQNKKRELGKTLLVFPSHSTHYSTMDFDVGLLIDEIEKVRLHNGFQSVLVCLYWKDILQHLDKRFAGHGYKFVTAGHIHDPYFLFRLKSIFLLADVAMGNTVGTNIGYSIACGVPYYLQDIPVRYTGEDVHEWDERQLDLWHEARACLCFYREDIPGDVAAFIVKYWGEWDNSVDNKCNGR